MTESITEGRPFENKETASSCIDQSDIEQQLKGLARRIEYHVGRGELDAASVLSSDMLSIAEGRSHAATEPHDLPLGKSFSWKYRLKLVDVMTVLSSIALVIVIALAHFHRTVSVCLVDEFMHKGKCAQAIRTLEIELAVEQFFKYDDWEVRCAIADTYVCDGQYDLAKRVASQVIEKFKDCGWAYDILGHCEYYEGDFSDAEKHYASSLEYESDRRWNTKVMYLALAKFKQGKNIEANDTLKLLNPSEDKSPFELAGCARYQGNDARACELYSGLLQSDFRLLYQDDLYSYVRYLRDYSEALFNLGKKVEAEGISKLAAQAQIQFKLDERFLSKY